MEENKNDNELNNLEKAHYAFNSRMSFSMTFFKAKYVVHLHRREVSVAAAKDEAERMAAANAQAKSEADPKAEAEARTEAGQNPKAEA